MSASGACDPLPLADDQHPAIVALRGRGVVPSNLYRSLAHQPALLEAWTTFAWTLRRECVTPRALRELLILRAAQLQSAAYVWQDHVAMALEAGVPMQQIAALERWPESDRFSAPERAALHFAEMLIVEGHVDDKGLGALCSQFDAGARIELTLTAAFYAMAPRVLDALRVPLRPVDGPPPPVAVPLTGCRASPGR